MKKKLIVKNLVIDADNIPYVIAPSFKPKKDGLDGDVVKPIKTTLKKLKKAVKAWFKDILKVRVKKEFALRGWKLGEWKVIFSDPKGNFRYDIFPEYKASRKGIEKSKEFYKIRKALHKKYGYAKGVEADDIVAYYVREEGYIGVTADKDLWKGVAGLWYNCHHMHQVWKETTVEEAHEFMFCQTLAGDSTDGIKGINRVAIPTAMKLLGGDYTWAKVVEIYESKGLTEDDAILTRRLIAMNQVTIKKDGSFKIKLFKPKKVKHEKEKNEARQTTIKSSPKNGKEDKKVSVRTVKRRTPKREDAPISKGDSKIQKTISDNPEGRFIGYYKSEQEHKNIISQSVYNKLSRNAKKEYSEIKA